MTTAARYCTAVHESAHACVADRLSFYVWGAEIIGDYDGECRHTRDERSLMKVGMVYVAGLVADAVESGDAHGAMLRSAYDLQTLREILSNHGVPPAHHDPLISSAIAEVGIMLARLWPTVEAVAEELMKCGGELHGEKIRRIIRQGASNEIIGREMATHSREHPLSAPRSRARQRRRPHPQSRRR